MDRRSKLQRLPRQVGVDAAARDALKSGGRIRKYRNCPTAVNGELFDSRKEARRYVELRLLERAGQITNLTRGRKYEFAHNQVRIGSYRPDFEYTENGQQVVEDVKSTSTKTQTYRLRKKMMKAFHGIEVKET